MVAFATLSLGTRKDAESWEKGCVNLGFERRASIQHPSPSLDALAEFFQNDAEWLYFGGHFDSMRLYNEADTTFVKLGTSTVTIGAGGKQRTLSKGTDFKLDLYSRVILWGGCSVCSGNTTVETMRRLFGNHVLLGFAGSTGWKMVDAMLGGGFLKNDFFDRVKRSKGWSSTGSGVVTAWMDTAAAGYAKSENESKFRAFDWEGQEFLVSKGTIVKGRMIK